MKAENKAAFILEEKKNKIGTCLGFLFFVLLPRSVCFPRAQLFPKKKCEITTSLAALFTFIISFRCLPIDYFRIFTWQTIIIFSGPYTQC